MFSLSSFLLGAAAFLLLDLVALWLMVRWLRRYGSFSSRVAADAVLQVSLYRRRRPQHVPLFAEITYSRPDEPIGSSRPSDASAL